MALQHVEGTIYKIVYRNKDFTSQSVTIVGSYSPEVVWAMAECLKACVKTTWFNEDSTVVIDSIVSIGESIDLPSN